MLAFLFLALVSLASPLLALTCNGGDTFKPNVSVPAKEVGTFPPSHLDSTSSMKDPACFCYSHEFYKGSTYAFSVLYCGVDELSMCTKYNSTLLGKTVNVTDPKAYPIKDATTLTYGKINCCQTTNCNKPVEPFTNYFLSSAVSLAPLSLFAVVLISAAFLLA